MKLVENDGALFQTQVGLMWMPHNAYHIIQ